MLVAAAQIRSVPGDVPANTGKHLAAVRLAASKGADMIVFPELSLTGYEPSLAEALAFAPADSRLDRFRDEATKSAITIGVGVPTRAEGKPKISQVFFTADGQELVYSKRFLHEDEVPFFQEGDQQRFLEYNEELLVPAICYEARLPEHAAQAAELGATAYVACVAKPRDGVEKAYDYFRQAARHHAFTVILSNAVGRSDSFVSVGRSAAWNRDGDCLVAAGDEECILLVDLDAGSAAIEALIVD